MKMSDVVKGMAGGAGILALGSAAIAKYFFNRTMLRSEADVERTMKMAGTDWNQYTDIIKTRREALLARDHEEVFIESDDGLKLHAWYFPNEGAKKLVICFHGYTSEGINDYPGLSDYYLRNGFSMLIPDLRTHGKSEGTYVGFGCLDRKDAIKWINWAVEHVGEDIDITLHGTSMGGATVLMTSGLSLPPQVKGIVSDCGFTSAREVFTFVLKTMYHIPPEPILLIADQMCREKAGYTLDECNSKREVEKAGVPILLIHGTGDTFVPPSMCPEIKEHCASPCTMVLVEGAAHAESYYKDMPLYERTLDEFFKSIDLM